MRKSKNKVIAMMLAFGVTASMLFTSIPGALSALTGTGNTITKAEAAIEFYTKLEAEDATMTGDVKAASTRTGFSGTGYATGFTQASNNSWSMPVTIPAEGFYTFTIRSTADSYKENFLYINGAQTGTIYCTGDSLWGDTVIESVYLEAGTVTLSIKESWGWFDLDYIEIKNGAGVEDSVYEKATSTLVNPNANQKTKNIMTYLRSIYGKKTLSGQSGTLNTSTEFDTLYRTTGKYPAIRMLDFIFCSPASDWHSTGEVDLALDWNKKGGLTTFQWHWHAPKGGASFYTEKTSFDLSKAVTTQNISRKPLSEIKAMYEAGTITEETYLMVRDIDAISGYLAQLEDAGVTVLWRPLHEASGGWFWWGAAGEDSYLWLYRLMFDRQTYYHELNNLIWVWNGQDADWYPGDEFCDIIGTDIYADKHNYSAQTAQFKKTVNYSGGNKMAALTENGVMVDPALMSRDNTYWLWFAVWYGDFLIDYNGNLNGVYTEASMVNKVYNSDQVITLDELPDFDGTNPTGVPTATPTVAPTATPTITPTVTPIVTPTVTPTVAPTATPIPSGDFTLTLTNTGNTAASTNTIKNNIRLKHESGSDIDLSKLVIRYYYTKDGSASENFNCDTAAVQYNKAPWYVTYNSAVSGSFHSLTTPKTNADSYLELKVNTTDALTAGSTLVLDTRFTKNDWSLYNQSNDYSYGDNSKVLVYYDGELILGVEP
jgi:mannan endo-1,4-beta-mannosidase